MTTRPLWLQSVAITSLLNLLVDRLDAAELRGSARAGSVALGEKTWPALYRAERESDKEFLWTHLGDMARWGWLSVKPEASLKMASGYAMSPKVTVEAVAEVRAAVDRPKRTRSSLERWRAAVDAHLVASPEIKAAVGEFCIDLPGYDMASVAKRLNGLGELAASSLLLREVSSRLFWGMSKVLDKRQGLVCAILGTTECPFPESPVQLQVFLPDGVASGILFIENALTYEQALDARAANLVGLAVAFASGFRGSAQRLRTPSGSSLHYSNKGDLSADARRRFEDWLYRGIDSDVVWPTYFWGDLDHSGMGILAALRASFPGARAWAPGYEPMLEVLEAGGGHLPEAAEKQRQRIVMGVGCGFADARLIPAMIRTGRFVDQEAFRP